MSGVIVIAEGDYGTLTMVNTASERKDITIIGEGEVTIELFDLGTSSSFNNISFENIKFDGTASGRAGIYCGTEVNGLTVKNCDFVNAANITVGENFTISNLLVEECSFDQTGATGKYSPIYISGTSKGTVQVKNNTFTNSAYNAVQVNGTVNANVEVTGNTINGTVDRALRFGALQADKTIVIENNTISNVKEEKKEMFKISSVVAGATVTFEGNSYDEIEWDPADITVAATDVVYYYE